MYHTQIEDDPFGIKWDQSIQIESFEQKLLAATPKDHSYYECTLKCSVNNIQYNWPITFSITDARNLYEELKPKIKEPDMNLPKIPTKPEFKALNIQDRLDFLHSFLQSAILNYFSTTEVRKILEISPKSFTSNIKLKEGYINKERRDRKMSHAYITDYIKRTYELRWLRLRENGLEYLIDQVSEKMNESMFFTRDFSVKLYGSTKLKITSDEYDLIIDIKSQKKRQLWFDSITQALSRCDFYNFVPRFGSSFPVRHGNHVKAYIDGENYYSDVYDNLISAKDIICIADWWMCPQVYLKRPPTQNEDSRLDRVLVSASQRGVKVYIIVYLESKLGGTNNSLYVESTFAKYSNIKVIRHPFNPRLPHAQDLWFWSHHEKMVIIDNAIVFMGGLDLCLGRWDTQEHKLRDDGNIKIWNGMDYSNVRVKDFVETDNYLVDSVNRKKIPRMPWHDVAIQIKGNVVYDLICHFRDRWNFMVKDTLSQTESLPIVDIPVLHLDYDILDPSHDDHQQLRQVIQETFSDINDPHLQYTDILTTEEDIYECQLVISASSWSLGKTQTEHSIQNAYIELIQNSEHFIYIENQYFISSTASSYVENQITNALTDRIIKAASENSPFKVIILLPLIPAYEGELDTYNFATTAIKEIMSWQYKTISRSPSSIFARLKERGIDPSHYINFYSLRTHGVLNDGPVTEQVYIHAKIMIVDDKNAIIGSANLNDRSMNGDRDSEVAIVIKEGKMVKGKMVGESCEVSEFAHKLRVELCMEHLGVEEISVVEDPFEQEFCELWENTARVNTEQYRKVFRCYPDNEISLLSRIQSYGQQKEINGYSELERTVKGQLVQFPLEFLSEEKLKKTDYLPNIVLRDELYT